MKKIFIFVLKDFHIFDTVLYHFDKLNEENDSGKSVCVSLHSEKKHGKKSFIVLLNHQPNNIINSAN